MRRSRSIHPNMFRREEWMLLSPEASMLILAVGTFTDYADRFQMNMQALAEHCGWAWSAPAFDELVAARLIVVSEGMATVTFDYGFNRKRISRWEAIRSQVFERDGFACQYCGDHAEPLHCDHIHPKSRGGSDDLDNLTTACGPCNMSKGSRTLAEWVRHEQ